MSVTSLTEKYCQWISLKIFVIIIGIWGLFVGFLTFLNSMVFSITLLQRQGANKTHELYDAYGAIHIVLFEFAIALITIFSCYLLYGTFREFPGKSTYVLAWLIFACVSDVMTLVDFVSMTIRYSNFFSRPYLIEQVILLGAQFVCIGIVFAYYRTLPKRQFNTT